MSYVPSGILYNRGFPFITFEPFNGELNDSSKSMLLSFSMAYAAMAFLISKKSSPLIPLRRGKSGFSLI